MRPPADVRLLVWIVAALSYRRRILLAVSDVLKHWHDEATVRQQLDQLVAAGSLQRGEIGDVVWPTERGIRRARMWTPGDVVTVWSPIVRSGGRFRVLHPGDSL